MNINIDTKDKVWGIPVIQNQQDFVIGVFTIRQILKFTKYTHRLIVGYDEENMPVYNPEIQREVEKLRVEKIADFLIEDREATFPTNIVLHIPIQVVSEQKKNGQLLELHLDRKVYEGVENANRSEQAGDVYITIIDGQHRVRGIEVAIERLQQNIQDLQKTLQKSPNNQELLKRLDYYGQRLKDLLDIQLVVSFFIDKSLEYQAMIFSTINRTQKRVSESLVYDLFGLTTKDSPQKTSLQIVLALNSHPRSPFCNRINLYGEEYKPNQSPPLSQATMIKSIIGLISEDVGREAENDRRRDRKDLLKRSLGSKKILPFRIYYATNRDSIISDILFYYFNAVKETFVNQDKNSIWEFNPETMKPTNVLHTTVGYQALLKILIDILEELSVNNNEADKLTKTTYMPYLQRAKPIEWYDLQKYPFTSKTANILYYDMSLLIWPAKDSDDVRITKRQDLLEKQ